MFDLGIRYIAAPSAHPSWLRVAFRDGQEMFMHRWEDGSWKTGERFRFDPATTGCP